MNYKGTVIACFIICFWFSLFYWLNFVWKLQVFNLGLIALLTFLYTGLFITAHDSMHGNVYKENKFINDFLGYLAVALYAAFDYKKLYEKHWLHHEQPATQSDPDFHNESNQSFWAWYFNFMKNYLSFKQLLIMSLVGSLFQIAFGVSLLTLVFYWVLPSVLSTFQLFYFGTYLPHKPSDATKNNFKARSLSFPSWLSFLACYHFGYHYEHHAHPELAWWQLPSARKKQI